MATSIIWFRPPCRESPRAFDFRVRERTARKRERICQEELLPPFSGQLNADLRKLAVNMVPFPRLHFFMVRREKDKEYHFF